MPEKPILFSAPMVRAILAKRKRVTRRIIKPQTSAPKPRYNVGDVLWVKEWWSSYQQSSVDDRRAAVRYGGADCLARITLVRIAPCGLTSTHYARDRRRLAYSRW